jgi:hypothetical protein
MAIGLVILAVAMWLGWRARRDARGGTFALGGFWLGLAFAASALLPYLVFLLAMRW